MLTITGLQKRTVWISMVGVIVMLAIGPWLMNEWNRHHPTGPDETTPRTSRQAERDGGPMPTMPMAPSLESGPAQAYAMMAPMKQQLIGVKTAVVDKRPLETVLRAVGRIDYDEQRIARINLRVSGWVEDLMVDYTGQVVTKGQPLLTLYSPDLVATQDEYLLALRAQEQVKDSPIPEVRRQAEQMVEAARDRLQLWTLTDEQITELARRGKAQTSMTLSSPIRGYVIDKRVFKGMFVEPAMTLYTIADLSTVWVNAEIYEHEVPFVQLGQPATVTFSSYPGKPFHGHVSYIYPYLNKEARTVKVRLELPNPGILLKPEMYGEVQIKVSRGPSLAIPEQAVLDSGRRQLVFVVRGAGLFEPRTVTLGSKIGTYYEVREGITPGERVVTSGHFLIDSESKLTAATNMMGALGMGGIKMEQAHMGTMDMGGMEMARSPSQEATPSAAATRDKTQGGLTLALSTEPTPPRIGENLIRVTVRGEGDKPVLNATVQLTYTMPMPGMLPATVPMKQEQGGAYETKVNLGMGGQWNLTVTVQRVGQPAVTESFSVTAGGGGMSSMPGM